MFENKALDKIAGLLMMVENGSVNEQDALQEIKDVANRTKNTERSEKWACLKEMPPLYHKLPNEKFDLGKSEVLNWLGTQKEAMNWLLMSANKNGYLEFDFETRKWKGVNYSDD